MNTRIPVLALLSLTLLSVGGATEIKRYCFGEWSERIGYSEAVAVGETLYLSGIVADGDTMEQSLSSVLAQVDVMLRRFNLGRGQILKEKIYTNDKDALRKATALRKEFYGRERPAAVWIETQTNRKGAWIEMELIIHIPAGHKLPDPSLYPGTEPKTSGHDS